MKTRLDPKRIFDAAAANGASVPVLVADLDDIVASLNTTGTFTGTIKFVGSNQLEAPDFDTSRSESNQWEYLRAVDLEDGAAIEGDTGIALAADDNREIEINVNSVRWVGAIISGYTQGQMYLDVSGQSN